MDGSPVPVEAPTADDGSAPAPPCATMPLRCATCQKGEAECGSGEGGEAINLRLCTGCRAVYYCGPACQRSDRKQHRPFCKAKAAERARAAALAQWKEYHPPSPAVACPACELPMPLVPAQHVYRACCGRTVCHGCAHDATARASSGTSSMANGAPTCPACDEGYWYLTGSSSTGDALTLTQQLQKRIDEEGDAIAMEQLAYTYLCGQRNISDERKRLGTGLLREAADRGSLGACCRMAMFHQHGHFDFKVCQEKELEYMTKAAAAGGLGIHAQLSAKAANAEDWELTYHHARIAAEAGDGTAMDFLESLYRGDLVGEFVTEEEYLEIRRIGTAAAAAMESESRARAERF